MHPFPLLLLLIVSYCRFIFAHGGCVSRRAVIFFLLHRASFREKSSARRRRLVGCTIALSHRQTDSQTLCFSQSRLALVWFTGWPPTQAGLSWMDFWPCSCSNWTLVLSCDPSPMHLFSFGLKSFINFERAFFFFYQHLTLKLTWQIKLIVPGNL